jgi:hypothetical protein
MAMIQLPKTRVYFSRLEVQLIREALNVVCNRLATARLGSFPYGDPTMRWAGPSSLHQKRQYLAELDQVIVRTRAATLQPSCGKLRFNCIQIAVLQFALRHAVSPGADRETARAVIPKLENHRKRAKRATLNRAGEKMYGSAVKECQAFASWMRYCLFFRPRRRKMILRATWRLQVAGVKKALAEVPERRGYTPLSEAQVERMKKLTMAEIRRGRAPVLLRDILEGAAEGQEYIFEFAQKRVALVAVREDAKPQWQRVCERNEKFKRSLTVQMDDAISTSSAPRQSSPPTETTAAGAPVSIADGVTDTKLLNKEGVIANCPATTTQAGTNDVASTTAAMPLIDTSQPTEAEQDFSDESLVDGLVDALFPILGGFPYWQTLRDDARFRCGYNPEAFLRHIKRNSVSELIRACRPALDTSSSYGLNESVTEWVMSTLLAAGRNVIRYWSS